MLGTLVYCGRFKYINVGMQVYCGEFNYNIGYSSILLGI